MKQRYGEFFMTALLTKSEIARRLQCAPWTVDYFLRTRGIRPAIWAGRVRVFSDAQFSEIKAGIEGRKNVVSKAS
jgi:hypothetical protein